MRAVTSPRTFGLILGNESYKGLLILWSHRVTLVPEVAVVAVTYLLLQFLFGGGSLVAALLPATLLGFLAYAFIYVVTLRMSAGILEEMNAGTLEQIHLSPGPAWLLSRGRLVAALAEGSASRRSSPSGPSPCSASRTRFDGRHCSLSR